MADTGNPIKDAIKLDEKELEKVSGGVKKSKYVSAFYCEYCKKTIRLTFVRELEKAQKEHNAKFHPGLREPRTTEV